MKRWLYAALACVLLHSWAGAQTNPGQQPAAGQTATQSGEASSPELLEAQRLNVEVLTLYRAGKYEEATEPARRVLLILEKALPPGDPKLNSALTNLGEIFVARRRYAEAKDYYQRLLANHEQSPVPDNAMIGKAVDRLAYLNYMELDFDKAEKLYQRALALREQDPGAKKLELGRALFNLAEFYRVRGDYKRAEPLYQRAIEIKGTALGPDDEDVKRSLDRYSCLYYATNQRARWKDVRGQFSFLRQQDKDADDGEVILNGKAVSLARPTYPVGARQSRLSGTVVIQVSIDETGKVIKAGDMCGAHPLFAASAMAAAYHARFSPTLSAGVPIPTSGVIVYRFVAQ
ncbi:MAG TPA: TonB family protein [Pyrinomonadaceae bacterium]|nr:TonB family protein [Pyrinomonadaceae bacterium]